MHAARPVGISSRLNHDHVGIRSRAGTLKLLIRHGQITKEMGTYQARKSKSGQWKVYQKLTNSKTPKPSQSESRVVAPSSSLPWCSLPGLSLHGSHGKCDCSRSGNSELTLVLASCSKTRKLSRYCAVHSVKIGFRRLFSSSLLFSSRHNRSENCFNFCFLRPKQTS